MRQQFHFALALFATASSTLASDLPDESLTSSARELKVGMISDLQLNPLYNASYAPGAEGDCSATSGTLADTKAPLGRYGCDPPVELIDTMLDAFNEYHGKQDVIILSGDFASHHAMDATDLDAETTYAGLLAAHTAIVQRLAAKFPDTLILPVFGNSDNHYHDSPTTTADEAVFYGALYDLWFNELPANWAQLTAGQHATIQETFQTAGYYRVDLTDQISVLALNTRYWASERVQDDPEFWKDERSSEEMVWLYAQLSEDSDRQFILASHTAAGAGYEPLDLWNELPNDAYFSFLKEFKDRVIIELAGHDDVSSLRAHRDDASGELYASLFIAPSISPRSSTNPGVTSFEISEELVPGELRSTFLNLAPTIGQETALPFEQLEFRRLAHRYNFDMPDITAESIYRLTTWFEEYEYYEPLHWKMLILMMGLNPEDASEFDQAIEILIKKQII